MSRIRLIIAALVAFLPASAFGQSVQLDAGQIFGNSTAATRNGRAENVTAILDRALGSTRGSILERGASSWGIVAPGTTGFPYVSNGAGADPSYQVLPLVGGGTGSGTAGGARTNLGLVIGTNVEAWDADLDCLAALGGTGVIRRTGAGTCSNGTAVTNAELATMLTNTVKGNATSGAAVPTDLAVPSCSGATSALIWTTNTGYGCNTIGGVTSLGGAAGVLDTPSTLTSGRALTNSDCENPLLLGNNTQFTMTVNAPSTYTCSRFKLQNIDVYTGASSGRGKFISATLVSGATGFWLMPGQRVDLVASGASAWQPDQQMSAIDGVTYVARWANNAWVGFVNSGASASDATQDGLADGALGAGSFASIHHCVKFFYAVMDNLGVNQANCTPKTGQTFADNNVQFVGVPVGSNGIFMSGNGGAFTWTATGSCATINDGAVVIFQNVNLTCNSSNTSNVGHINLHQAVIIDTFTAVTFTGAGSNSSAFFCDSNCRVNIDNGLTYAGTFGDIIRGGPGTNFNVNGTFAGSVTLGQLFTQTGSVASIVLQGNVTYTWSLSGSPRQFAVFNASVLCSLGPAIPGTSGILSTAGSAAGFLSSSC